MPPGLITVASCLLVPLLSSSTSLSSHEFSSTDPADNFDKLSTSLSSSPSPHPHPSHPPCIFLPLSRSPPSSARSPALPPHTPNSARSLNRETGPVSVCKAEQHQEEEHLFHNNNKKQKGQAQETSAASSNTEIVSTLSLPNRKPPTPLQQIIHTLPLFTMQDDGDESVSRHFPFPSSSSSSSSRYPFSTTSTTSTTSHHYGFPSSSSSSASASASMGAGQYPFPSMRAGSTGSGGQKEREEIKDICDVCQRVLQLATGSSKALGVGLDTDMNMNMDEQMGMMMKMQLVNNNSEGECTCPQHSLISSSSLSSSASGLSEGLVGPLGPSASRDPSSRPVVLLSQHLLRTYEAINNKYYASLSEALPEDYEFQQNELMGARYQVLEVVGKGTFGQVAIALDGLSQQTVAIKVIKKKDIYMEQAMSEISILQHIMAFDPNDQFHIVRLYESFMHKGYLCIVFEKLYCNLYDLLKRTNFTGLSLNLIREFGTQILRSLSFLQSSPINIIHADLKPENILLLNIDSTSIKLIDFGSSCPSSHLVHAYIQSRFYRAPEVIMEMEYGPEIDMWSFGCILIEMHVGMPLFPGLDESDQLLRIATLLGLPPDHLIESASPKKRSSFFARSDRGWRFLSHPNIVKPTLSLETVLERTYEQRKKEVGHTAADYNAFVDLLKQIFVYDPRLRIKPLPALHHPFFSSPPY